MKIKQSHGIIVLIIAIAISVLGYGFLKNRKQNVSTNQTSLPPSPTTSAYGAAKPAGCGCNKGRT